MFLVSRSSGEPVASRCRIGDTSAAMGVIGAGVSLRIPGLALLSIDLRGECTPCSLGRKPSLQRSGWHRRRAQRRGYQ